MKFPYEEKALLYTELAKLHRAGFPLPQAIDAVADTHPAEATMNVLVSVKDGLAAGKTIGEAFAFQGAVPLTELERSIVGASERGGVLEDGFEHLASYFKMRGDAARSMRRKMIYPLVLIHFAVFVPMIPLMINSPSPMMVVLQSVFVLLAVYGLLFVVLVVGKKLAAKAETDPDKDRLLARVPLLGRVRQNLALARFSSVFRMHVLAGERMEEGLRSAALASQSGQIMESIAKDVTPAVTNGEPIGPMLVKNPRVYTSAFAGGFSTAELSGSLDTDLLRWSQRFHEAAGQSMDRLSSRAPMIFYALIVLVVLWQILRLVLKIIGYYTQAFDMLDDA